MMMRNWMALRNLIMWCPLCSQNHVRTEACGAERPLRSRKEHSAEEADEGTWGRLWIQRVTYVWGGSCTGAAVSQLIMHWLISVNLLTLSRRHFTLTLVGNITDDLFLGFFNDVNKSSPHRHHKKPPARRRRWQRYSSFVFVGDPSVVAFSTLTRCGFPVCFSPLCLLFHISQPCPPTQSITSTTLLTPKWTAQMVLSLCLAPLVEKG